MNHWIESRIITMGNITVLKISIVVHVELLQRYSHFSRTFRENNEMNIVSYEPIVVQY
jgi:hypothetical protein